MISAPFQFVGPRTTVEFAGTATVTIGTPSNHLDLLVDRFWAATNAAGAGDMYLLIAGRDSGIMYAQGADAANGFIGNPQSPIGGIRIPAGVDLSAEIRAPTAVLSVVVYLTGRLVHPCYDTIEVCPDL